MEGSVLKVLELHANKLQSLDFMHVLAENKQLMELEVVELCIEKKKPVEKTSDSDASTSSQAEYITDLTRNSTLQRLKLSKGVLGSVKPLCRCLYVFSGLSKLEISHI